MCKYNISSLDTFFFKKNSLFSLERANKQKKNLILPLAINKVKNVHSQNEPISPFIMHIRSAYHFFVLLASLSLLACSSDEMVLTIGEGVLNDDHQAYYTDDFKIESETKLASYVSTNNSGVALAGSYSDDYIGDITTNTVFKISPLVYTENATLDKSAIYDSMAVILFPNGYVYGDTTSTVNLTLHQLTEDYTLDTLIELIDGVSYTTYHKTNYSTTEYDPTPLANISFVPEDERGDSVIVFLSDDIGQAWFDNMMDDEDYYTISSNESSDEEFVENIFNGLTLRSVPGNNAIVGFDMPTSDDADVQAGINIRMYYHTVGPYEELYHDFTIYYPTSQYNQITADFSTGVLDGIEPGGDGIPSSETGGLTFIQSGVGLMTNIEIPTLQELYNFGSDLTILNLDLDFQALPYSFTEEYPLPSDMTIEKLKYNGRINIYGLLNFSEEQVSISTTYLGNDEAQYTIPITRYGWEEQDLISASSAEHNSLLITPRSNGSFIPNVNRMIIGDSDNADAEMKVEMYYTIFE